MFLIRAGESHWVHVSAFFGVYICRMHVHSMYRLPHTLSPPRLVRPTVGLAPPSTISHIYIISAKIDSVRRQRCSHHVASSSKHVCTYCTYPG